MSHDVPSIIPALRYQDASAAIDFLVDAFGFARNAVYASEDGRIDHAQLTLGSGMVMLGSAAEDDPFSAAGPASIYVIVDDADAHHDRAVAGGAEVIMPLTDEDYGGRGYTALDPEGNLWSFGTYRPDM